MDISCNVANSRGEFQPREDNEWEVRNGEYNTSLLKFGTRGGKALTAQRTPYGRGESGRMGTPEDGPDAFGRGESGRIGTPDESFDTFGRGESGRMGTPLANEIA